MWPTSVKESALIACGRKCCICHRFCGLKIELHHLIQETAGGKSDFDNCIPLCFDCHADAGHYNQKHPKGTKYSPSELRTHRDNWYLAIKKLTAEEARWYEQENKIEIEVYEGQEVQLNGYVWREAFPGPPNYESFETDTKETYWMLILPEPVTLFASDLENENTYKIDNIKKLQLLVHGDFYKEHSDIVLSNVKAKGKLIQSHTGHHHGQALFELTELIEKNV